MAMTEDEIRDAARRSFRVYAQKKRWANRVLGSAVALLKQGAEVSRISPERFDAIVREEMDEALQRMKADEAASHPVAAALSEGS
ncbi:MULTISPECIES: hypothetical protein [unclassified Leisingera]|uniref:hypothetical protein n=1 Tax=unclassified Leisingera TaxID=2614906 RepID=UPI001012F04D|nr:MULTISPECIES: hypothetical protein [unclassified Leisingera]MCF6432928.1 hypothetical protein [Leisingera sp. MMG026]QAX29289.1 hypothetical protein ETW24_07935 [Leisingera sp. NJS204]